MTDRKKHSERIRLQIIQSLPGSVSDLQKITGLARTSVLYHIGHLQGEGRVESIPGAWPLKYRRVT